jgi:hypothetical protein
MGPDRQPEDPEPPSSEPVEKAPAPSIPSIPSRERPEKRTLSDLLARSLADELTSLEGPPERERWDEDEGCFGG